MFILKEPGILEREKWMTVRDRIDISNRRNEINFLRGVAVFLMMWGHSIQCASADQFVFFENAVFRFIYSFHMPLFMLISGYLFFFSAQKRDLPQLLEHKLKSLLYPIFTCSVLNYLITNVVSALYHGNLAELTSGVPFDSLWFFWSVLAASLAMSFSMKLSRNSLIRLFLALIGLVFALILPWWQLNVYMYPYFIIGLLYAAFAGKKGFSLFTCRKKVLALVFLGSAVLFLFLFPHFHRSSYIYTTGIVGGATVLESLKIDCFRWIIGFAGCLGVISLCVLAYPHMKSRIRAVTDWVERAGEDSLAIYALCMSLLTYYLPKLSALLVRLIPTLDWNRIMISYNFVLTPLIAFGYTCLIMGILRAMRKLGLYHLLFGR